MQVRLIGDYSNDADFVESTGLNYGEIADVWQGEDCHPKKFRLIKQGADLDTWRDIRGNTEWPARNGRLWIVTKPPKIKGEDGKEVEANKAYHKLTRGQYIRLFPDAESLRFRDVRPTRRRFARAALKLQSLDFHQAETFITWPEGFVGKPQGHTSCVGAVLTALLLVRLLPDGFDLNVSPAHFGGKKPAKTLWEMLRVNATQVEKSAVVLGDICLLRYADLNSSLKRPHHVGIVVQETPLMMLHAAATSIGGQGRVMVEPIDPRTDPLMWQRVEEVWRVNNLRD